MAQYLVRMLQACAIAAAGALIAGCGGGGDDGDQGNVAPRDTDIEAVSEADTSMENAIDEAALRRRIKTLSSDAFEGRAPATPGGEKTRAFLIDEMKAIGLEPGNGDSYEQETPLLETTLVPDASFFAVNGENLSSPDETVFWTKRVVDAVSFEDSPVVFVGYGAVAPEYGWNDYEGLDVAGKTVVMLVNDPGFATKDPDLFNGNAMTYYGRWTYKFEEAARQGATAAIVIHQTEPASYGWGVVSGGWTGPQLDLERPDGGASRTALEGWITEEKARALFAKANLDFDALAEAAQKPGFKPVAMEGLTASAALKNTIRRSSSANVAGVLRGAEAPDEYVLYMAHWDHLGVDPTAEGDKIANGAVDNATGTAGILSIAERFAARAEAPRRSVLFLAVTAEESGLLGSAYFAEKPFAPLENIVGGVNIDGLGPMPPTRDIAVVGYGASELDDVLTAVAGRYDYVVTPEPTPEKGYFYRSDHISLAKKGVPMLYADPGVDLIDGGVEAGLALADDYIANRYHKPGDEYTDDWDMRGMMRALSVFHDVGAALADSEDWPNWREGNEFRALRDAQRPLSE